MSVENRRYPRYSKRFRVQIGELELHTTNISAGGLQLACPGMRMLALEPKLVSGQIRISLELPGTEMLDLPCSVVYSNKAGDEWLIGLRFAQPEARLAELVTQLR